MTHRAKLAKDSVQVVQEVLEAMTETAQKQQRTRDEVQERFDQETSMSGCHKQRRKDLAERLRMEDTKLQRKQQNLKEAQGLRDRWQGECPLTLIRSHAMHTAQPACGSVHGSGSASSSVRTSCSGLLNDQPLEYHQPITHNLSCLCR